MFLTEWVGEEYCGRLRAFMEVGVDLFFILPPVAATPQESGDGR